MNWTAYLVQIKWYKTNGSICLSYAIDVAQNLSISIFFRNTNENLCPCLGINIDDSILIRIVRTISRQRHICIIFSWIIIMGQPLTIPSINLVSFQHGCLIKTRTIELPTFKNIKKNFFVTKKNRKASLHSNTKSISNPRCIDFFLRVW